MASAPTTELGYIRQGQQHGHGVFSTWARSVRQDEHVPELRHPASVATYLEMSKDSQISGLLKAIDDPLARYRRVLDPNGASDDVVQAWAEDLDLPILGAENEEPGPRRRIGGRFGLERHRREVRLARRYGNMWFNIVAPAEQSDRQWLRLRKLSARMPDTIVKHDIAPDGMPKGILQRGGVNFQTHPDGIYIPIEKLIAYVWDQEPGEWFGTSLLRPMYAHWLMKHVLMKVDAVKHERNGMGVPMGTEGPESGGTQSVELQAIAEALRAGEEAGFTLPHGAKMELLGVKGTLPDTIASVRYHDESMANAGLMAFLKLSQGSGATGSYALADVLVDFFGNALDSAASWEDDLFNEHVIERITTWNVGEEAACPRIVSTRMEDPELQLQDLALAVEKGLVVVDAETEAWFRSRHRLPARVVEDEPEPVAVEEPELAVAARRTIDEIRASKGLPARIDGAGVLTPHDYIAMYGGTRRLAVMANHAPEPVRAMNLQPSRLKRVLGAKATLPAEFLPDRALRRQPNQHEVLAATDFRSLEEEWTDSRDELVEAFRGLRQQQLDDLLDQIESAGPDLQAITQIAAPVLGADVLTDAMLDVADAAAAQQRAEATRQGVSIGAVDRAVYADALTQRAEVVATVMASEVTQRAVSNALDMANDLLTGKQMRDLVSARFDDLTDAYLEQKLGGAVTSSINAGRFTAQETGDHAKRRYSSELLDSNTCDPCGDVDDTEYATLEDAINDYPTGGYHACDGRDRCRGTTVVVFETETDATLEGEDDE